MPIHCPIQIPRIGDDEMRSIDYRVMEHVFATHNQLGHLADETVYQHELQRRLMACGIEAAIEVPIHLSFRHFATPLAIDLIAENKVIYELKAVSSLQAKHESQLLGYMFLTNSTRGKLVNFRTSSVEWRFVNTARTTTAGYIEQSSIRWPRFTTGPCSGSTVRLGDGPGPYALSASDPLQFVE